MPFVPSGYVANRLMRLKKRQLVALLADFGVTLPASASKAEAAAALEEQLTYSTDDESEDECSGQEESDDDLEFVGEISRAERDEKLRAEAVQID